jgi:hypothetical protein
VIYEVANKPKRLSYLLLDEAISFACNFLDLDIDFTLEFVKLKPYQCGFCDYDEEEIILTVSKSLSKDDMIKTIFHEMVHIKQYVDGRLENGSPPIWLGIIYEDRYENLPWEIEAFELEQKMVKEFYG